MKIRRVGSAPTVAKRRKYQRAEISTPFRAAIAESDTELKGRTRDVSAGGAALVSGLNLPYDIFVELHMEGVGGVSARVVRSFAGGFAVAFEIDDEERAALEAAIEKFRMESGELEA